MTNWISDAISQGQEAARNAQLEKEYRVIQNDQFLRLFPEFAAELMDTLERDVANFNAESHSQKITVGIQGNGSRRVHYTSNEHPSGGVVVTCDDAMRTITADMTCNDRETGLTKRPEERKWNVRVFRESLIVTRQRSSIQVLGVDALSREILEPFILAIS